MYIGPTTPLAALRLVADLVDVALADAWEPPCRHVQVILTRDARLVIRLYGGVRLPNTPAWISTDSPESQLVTALATILDRSDEHKLSPLALMNAFAAHLTLKISTRENCYQQSFVQGHPDSPVVVCETTSQQGLSVIWEPDTTIIQDWATISIAPLMGILRSVAALNPGVLCEVRDERSGTLAQLVYPEGLATYLTERFVTDLLFAPQSFAFEGSWNDVRVAGSVLWWPWTTATGVVESFVNGRATLYGGSHVRGFWRGLRDGLVAYAEAKGIGTKANLPLPRRELGKTFVGAVAVWLDSPRYSRATRASLGDGRAEQAVRHVLRVQLPSHLDTASTDAQRWLQYAVQSEPESDED